MAATAPPVITALPTPPDPNDRSTFNARAYPWSVAQQTLATEANAVAVNVYANAQEAKTQAEAATTNGAAQVALATAQAQAATTKAGEASTSAASAASSATAALASKNAAATSAADAEASRIAASKLNLGNKAAPPTVDNQGAALLAGATYYDTTLNKWRVWNGSAWTDGISAVAGVTSVNGQTGVLTGFVTDTGVQTLANKTLTDPKITLGGTNGAAGQVPVSQGAGLPPVWGAVGGVGNDYQEFLTSGTWSKPAGVTWVYIEAIGGGGGGVQSTTNCCGGGGGAYASRIIRAASLTSTVTVTIGAGGAANANGGNTTFGSYLTAPGGKTGLDTSDFRIGGKGGGGEMGGVSSNGWFTSSTTGNTEPFTGFGGYSSGGGGAFTPNTIGAPGGNCVMGGAGGGGSGFNGGGAGGVSQQGGNGGAGSARLGTAGNGVQPGGGGGASREGTAGSGAAGRVRVWAW